MGFKQTQKEHDIGDDDTLEYLVNLKKALEQTLDYDCLEIENIIIIKEHIKVLETAINLEKKR